MGYLVSMYLVYNSLYIYICMYVLIDRSIYTYLYIYLPEGSCTPLLTHIVCASFQLQTSYLTKLV